MGKSVKGTQTEKNLLTAFAGESQARNRYTFFASQARKEGYEQIANIFIETAGNEKEHAEIFFKYLGEEYALDALVEYATVPDDPLRPVPNPAWAAVDAQLRQAGAHLERLQAEYGLEAITNAEQQRSTMRGFKIAQGKLGQKIWSAFERVQQLEKRRAAVPRRVPVQALTEEPVVKLAPERKHLTNLIKMVAYQAESDLVRLVAPYYKRVEEARPQLRRVVTRFGLRALWIHGLKGIVAGGHLVNCCFLRFAQEGNPGRLSCRAPGFGD